jgi:RNA polymerase sigma-70 factor, ECF subfamily
VARRRGPCVADVADVVQNSFRGAARSARHFDESQGTLWSWLSGIARNHVSQYFRQMQRQARTAQTAAALGPQHDQVLTWLEGREAAPLETLMTNETARLVRHTLSELSGDYGALLSQKYLEGVSVEQMANERDASETAVRSRLARARQAFRQAFRDYATSFATGSSGTEDCDEPQ